MGQHSVPRRYLRNFSPLAEPLFIWLYDKKGPQPCKVAIKKVAQQRGFYDPEIEKYLADRIERPANSIIETVLQNATITPTDREVLVMYAATMLMRVPKRRERALALLPGVAQGTKDKVSARLLAAAERGEISQAALVNGITTIAALVDQYTIAPPEQVINHIRSPWPSKNVLTAVNQMTFRILTTAGPVHFLTCDNPAFFFSEIGLGNPQSELTLPLSTTHALHGSFQRASVDLAYYPVSQQCVKEINRRTVHGASRMVFYHENADWVVVLVGKPELRLNLMRL